MTSFTCVCLDVAFLQMERGAGSSKWSCVEGMRLGLFLCGSQPRAGSPRGLRASKWVCRNGPWPRCRASKGNEVGSQAPRKDEATPV